MGLAAKFSPDLRFKFVVACYAKIFDGWVKDF
jgi:hypothetical protein